MLSAEEAEDLFGSESDDEEGEEEEESGLQYLLDVSKFANIPIDIIDFDSWDYCVRSEEAKMWGIAFEQFEKRKEKV